MVLADVQCVNKSAKLFRMNGGMYLMDHEEMRAAYHRALNIDKTDFTDFCGLCKTSYISFSGEFIDIITIDKKYKIWHCQDCLDREKTMV
jgi:hypothetical protein